MLRSNFICFSIVIPDCPSASLPTLLPAPAGTFTTTEGRRANTCQARTAPQDIADTPAALDLLSPHGAGRVSGSPK